MRQAVLAFVLLGSALASAQDKPQPIAKKDLPQSAVCAVCVVAGTMMEAAKPSSGVMYKGKPYYFHGKEMRAAFLHDPEAFVPPVLPRPMPAFDLKDSGGVTYGADWFKGKVVLVDFWATWCLPCRATKEVLDSVRAKHPGLEVLSVGIDENRKTFDKYVKEKPFSNPVLFDTRQTFKAWHVVPLPAVFLVKDGQVVAQWTGATSESSIVDELAKG